MHDKVMVVQVSGACSTTQQLFQQLLAAGNKKP